MKRVNKEHKEGIFNFFDTLGMITFDLAVCLIKEMNLFNEDASTVAKYLNLECENVEYSVVEIKDGKEFRCSDTKFNLAMESLYIRRLVYFMGTPEKDYNDAEPDDIFLETATSDIKNVGLDNITIVTPEKYTFKLTRKPKYYSYAF